MYFKNFQTKMQAFSEKTLKIIPCFENNYNIKKNIEKF